MLYFDQDYKIDCENKILYHKIRSLSKSNTVLINKIKNCVDVDNSEKIYANYTDAGFAPGNIVLIIKTINDNFWVKNVLLCKEIAPRIFKIVLKA